MPATKVGELDKYIDVQEVDDRFSQDDGHPELKYRSAGRCWAKFEHVSAVKSLTGAEITAEASHRITIRWRPDVTTKHRLQMGNRFFTIVGLNNLEERNEWLVISATEAV